MNADKIKIENQIARNHKMIWTQFYPSHFIAFACFSLWF